MRFTVPMISSPAFQFQGIGMALLHDADGRCKTFHFVSLIRAEMASSTTTIARFTPRTTDLA